MLATLKNNDLLKQRVSCSALFFIILYLFLLPSTYGQHIGSQNSEESSFYAEVKQVGQFFRRFNNEEDLTGKKYDKENPKYRDVAQRKKYLSTLFDKQNQQIDANLQQAFVQDLINIPIFLAFHGGGWFAEVQTEFLYKKQRTTITLYLKLQEEKLGTKWVITDLYFPSYANIFNTDTSKYEKFLHPLSHELDFINLKQIFANKKRIEEYRSREHRIDMLTLFIYELKKGLFKFQTVADVKFHFFQIPGWYFELSEFNRSGFNRGWLISNLLKASDEQKDILRNYLYGKY